MAHGYVWTGKLMFFTCHTFHYLHLHEKLTLFMLHCCINFSEDMYDVEDILGKKVVDGVMQYRVKWKGFSSSNNTWEPKEHISKELIEYFNAV